MSLTTTIRNDKIEVVNHGDYSTVQVRNATIISENGTELSRSFVRHVVMPDADLTQEEADGSAIGTPVFTDAVKAAYQTHLSNQD